MIAFLKKLLGNQETNVIRLPVLMASHKHKPDAAPMDWLKKERGYWAAWHGLRDGAYEPTASEIDQRTAKAMGYLETKWRT